MTKASPTRIAKRTVADEAGVNKDPAPDAAAKTIPANDVKEASPVAPTKEPPPFMMLDVDRSRALFDWAMIKQIAGEVQRLPPDFPVTGPAQTALVLWLAHQQLSVHFQK